MMTAETRRQVTTWIRYSSNDAQKAYNRGFVSLEAYSAILHLEDKLAYRGSSAWQDGITAKYGFDGLTERINKIRQHWGLSKIAGGK